jgi:hypothetical protein
MRRAHGVALLLLVACGGESGTDPIDAGGSDPADASAPPTLDEPPAYVRISENTSGAGDVYGMTIYAQFRRSVLDVYSEVDRAGSCVLFESDLGFCQDPCDGVCTSAGVCLPFPEQLSAGTLTVDGLSAPVEIAPESGNYYSYYATSLTATPGASITASASGDDIAAFEVAATAPAPLEIPGLADLELTAGSDLVIEWTPSDTDSRIRLNLRSDTAGHGQYAPALILCDVADTGSLTVPQSLIDPFTDPANWGCGDCIPSWIERYGHGAVTAGDDGVDLLISSRVSLYLVVY